LSISQFLGQIEHLAIKGKSFLDPKNGKADEVKFDPRDQPEVAQVVFQNLLANLCYMVYGGS